MGCEAQGTRFLTTKKGTRYLVERQKGMQILLFPVGAHAKILCYAPTEKEILGCGDKEIIELYKKIDYENDEHMMGA